MEANGTYLFNGSYQIIQSLGPSEMPNHRCEVINQIGAQGIGPMVGQWHPKCRLGLRLVGAVGARNSYSQPEYAMNGI